MASVKDANILMEEDFARSSWHDERFAVWFAPFATHNVIASGPRASAFFRECGEFAKSYKSAPGSSGDAPSGILSRSAAEWYGTLDFPPLPGGKPHKPTAWQIEKARRYLRGRHDAKLAEQLMESEEVRRGGDQARADRIAAEARRTFAAFTDADVQCEKALSDPDEILRLAESNPPLFLIDGEAGRLLNYRLKPNNLGIILGDQKIAKTTTSIGLAVMSAKCVPTLFVSVGDEGKAEVNARVHTYLSCEATQPEFAGTFALPVPDCQHSADGSCPLALAGKPRDVKSWKKLVEDGGDPMGLAEGTFPGSRTFDGDVYEPCARCFPTNDGTPEDAERRTRWKSAVWYRKHTFRLCDRKSLIDTRNSFEIESH